MENILDNYPWMFWVILIGIIVLIALGILLFIFVKKDDVNEFESSDRVQQKIINEVMKEDKKTKEEEEKENGII